jgi:hypothetical protein
MKGRTINKYTVLLLLPDYVANEYGKDTYLVHVDAVDAKEGKRKAQIEAFGIQLDPDDADPDVLDDWYCLAIFEGHLEDIRQ